MDADVSTDAARSFADRLNHLFSTVLGPSGKPYSNDEVAAEIKATDVDISASYLWLLRKGDRANPTMRHVKALAGFFGVPPRYFLDEEDTADIDRQLAVIAAMRDVKVRHVALRVAGLSAESLDSVSDVIERIRQLEGLPEKSLTDVVDHGDTSQ